MRDGEFESGLEEFDSIGEIGFDLMLGFLVFQTFAMFGLSLDADIGETAGVLRL